MKTIPIACLLIIFLSECKAPAPPKFNEPLFTDLGHYQMKVTTKNQWTQKFFNQGLILAYAFNHAEAEKSFREAARLDSNCAMCYWGEALVNGPNINAPMMDTVYAKTYALVLKAKSKMNDASDKEKALINALAVRYPSPASVANRSGLDSLYADAMKGVMKQFPDDPDVQALTAEALMDKHPWDFWLKDGTAQPWTPEIEAILENGLKNNPNHPGLNHYYIHTMEASQHADMALASAERFDTMVPGAGHLVHMPAHIYLRTGKYHEAAVANEDAIKVDSVYLAQDKPQGLYPEMYVLHNYDFLYVAAAFEGRRGESIWAAEKVTAGIPTEMFSDAMMGATFQHYYQTILNAYIRFGMWDKILETPAPDTSAKYATALWNFARGYAFLGKNDLKQAESQSVQLSKAASDTSYRMMMIAGINSCYTLLNIASNMLKGEIAAKKNDLASAGKYFTTAIHDEDKTGYDEPPDWFFPVRHAYGAVLLDHGKYAEAEQVYRAELKLYPNDPWSLFGLYQSLLKQNKTDEAADVKKEFDEQWKYADFQLTSSRIL